METVIKFWEEFTYGNKKMEELNYGAIEQYNKQDYLVAGSELDIKDFTNQTENYFKNKIVYNQYTHKETKSMCTIFAGIGILSNYFNYKIDLETFLKLKKEALKDGFKEGVGWWIYKAVDLVRNWHNKNNKEQIITYRVRTGSWLFFQLLKKGYHCQGGYMGNRKYNNDRDDNCVIDNDEIGNPTYGHSIYFGLKENKLKIVDSRAGNKCEVYEIKDIRKLIEKGIFFKYVYFYIPKQNIMTQLEKDIQSVEKALELGITNDKRVLVDIKKGNYTAKAQSIIMIYRTYELILAEVKK